MNKSILVLTSILIASSVMALDPYNANITAIFGSGNPDTGWATDSGSDITLALRAKNRETASTANTAGVYSEPVGLQAPNNNRARWNWEFSINSGAVTLDTYDYYVGIDSDPSVGINHLVVNALTFWNDSSFGNDATLNGQGVEGTAAVYAGTYNIVQQSQNIVFYGQDPNANATYDYVLYAVEKNAGPDGEKLASVNITVVVGSGGATIPDLVNGCAAGAATHGDYVSCVTDLAKYLNKGGVISNKERGALVSTAAKSSIGN